MYQACHNTFKKYVVVQFPKKPEVEEPVATQSKRERTAIPSLASPLNSMIPILSDTYTCRETSKHTIQLDWLSWKTLDEVVAVHERDTFSQVVTSSARLEAVVASSQPQREKKLVRNLLKHWIRNRDAPFARNCMIRLLSDRYTCRESSKLTDQLD